MNGLNTTKTDLVEHMVCLEGTRRDPRNFLAAVGAPDLTAITDATEPDTSHTLKPPTTPAWTSAARRKARLSSYMSAGPKSKQLSAVAIPSTTSGDSPTKSPVPSLPAQENNSRGITIHTPPEHPSDYAPNGLTKVFRAPSYSGSTTTDDEESEDVTAEVETSPVKRPGAPTPSRWSRTEPSTPVQCNISQPATPGNTDPLGLLAAVPGSTTSSQPTPPSWKKWEKAASPQAVTFQFSDVSFEQTQARDQYSLFGSKADRRRSEPLLQHLLKDRARRFSTSPQKFFAGTDRFDEPDSTGPSTPVRPQRNSMGNNESPRAGNDSDLYTPLPSYLKPSFDLSQKRNDSPAKRNGFYKIDMRQNPDIFGNQASRDEPHDAAVEVKELANMVAQKCGGDANVVITHENGKLVVRFKLPAKYASLFPQSQGFDESLFTMTPSAISSSPRITSNGHQFQAPADQDLVGQDTTGDPMSLDELSMPAEKITAPADGASLEDTEGSSLSELDHTPTISAFREISVGSAISMSTRLPPNKNLVNFSPQKSPTKSVSFAALSSTYGDGTKFSSPMKRLRAPLLENDQTLIVGDFSTNSTHQLLSMDTPITNNAGPYLADSSPLETPTQQLLREAQEAPSSGLISDVDFEPTFQTPTYGHLDFSPSRVSNATPTRANQASGSTPKGKPTKASPTEKSVERTKTPTPSKQTPKATAEAAESTPTLATSFTPVNKPLSHSKPATPNRNSSGSSKEPEPVQDNAQLVALEVTKSKSDSVQDFDSPGRAYISAFIRRSKPKRATATETGSPMPNSGAREPLGNKSPNTGTPSPHKGKRKLDANIQEQDSPLKDKEEGPVKKPRHPVKAVKKEETEKKESKAETEKKRSKTETSRSTARSIGSSDGIGPKGTEAAEEAPRRSTRIRNQPAETQPSKSSIPTAIRLNRGNGAHILHSSARNEQAEVSRQTSLNTKRNRGNSESVQQILARFSEELSGEDADEIMAEPKPSKRGNNVGWREPLESFQQTPQAKKQAKTVPKPKPKPIQGNTGITKPKTAPKSRISQAAKNLGMTGNGTPAKRMTRAQTRRQT